MGRVAAVDIFCGAGGLTRGLLDSGIDVRAGYDIDEACRFPYERNNGVPFRRKDVKRTRPKTIKRLLGNGPSIIAGCAPCQPFSLLTNGAAKEDSRQHLLAEFQRIVAEVKPTYVTMENVPGLRRHPVFSTFVHKLSELGYEVDFEVIDCADYGVPQHRRRLVLLASKVGPLRVPPPSHEAPRTVKEAIGTLPTVGAGGENTEDGLHRTQSLSKLNLVRIKASRPGGTWADWPKEIRLECHKQESGTSYTEAYGRLRWDAPASPITTKFFNLGSGRFGHPQQDRALTAREAAILQSFPPDYRFGPDEPSMKLNDLGRMIGNAVPVLLGRAIGEAIVAHDDAVQAFLKRSPA